MSAAFNTNCVEGATVLTGSCTSSFYWSSTTDALFPSFAWTVNFFFGVVFSDNKSNSLVVRAVRGGL